jgi:predicted nucleotidyltransferase
MAGKKQKHSEIDRSTIQAALRELQAGLIRLYGKNTPAILVYGSYARGQAKPDSDLDVLLIYPKDIHPPTEIQRVSELLADLNLRYQVLISVLPISERDYHDSEGAFWKNVRHEGIPVESL